MVSRIISVLGINQVLWVLNHKGENEYGLVENIKNIDLNIGNFFCMDQTGPGSHQKYYCFIEVKGIKILKLFIR